MDKKMIEYLIIATVVILLLYSFISFNGYKYLEKEGDITDSIHMFYPSSSEYTVVGDTVEFRNSFYDLYNMDVSKISSNDGRVTNLLNHFASFNRGTLDYLNETCYVLTVEFDDGNGFKYHSIVIPISSFDKDSMSFTNETEVYLFDGNNREFVVDAVYNGKVVI